MPISPTVTLSAAQQQHRVWLGGWWWTYHYFSFFKSHGYIATHYFFLLIIKSLKSDRRTSKVCSFVTLFFKIFEATVKLLRLEVLWSVFIITEK